MIEILNIEDAIPAEVYAMLDESVVQVILRNVAEAARDKWIRTAGDNLVTSRNDYINGIQPVVYGDGTAVITLVGTLPNLIEIGMEQTDMRKTLLGPNVPEKPRGQGGKHKSKAGGFYRSIPFRHSGPDTAGAVGQPMGRQYSGQMALADTKKLGQEIYGQAKKLKKGQRLPAGLAPKLKPHHKTDIFAGMQKTGTKGHAQYQTFRTISENSPDGWIRPRTEGKNFSGQVREYAARLFPDVVKSYVEGFGE